MILMAIVAILVRSVLLLVSAVLVTVLCFKSSSGSRIAPAVCSFVPVWPAVTINISFGGGLMVKFCA